MTRPPNSQRLELAVANDARTNELGVHIEVTADHVVVSGEVASAERRAAVLAVVHERAPDVEIIDQLELSDATEPPDGAEVVDVD